MREVPVALAASSGMIGWLGKPAQPAGSRALPHQASHTWGCRGKHLPRGSCEGLSCREAW